MIVSKLSLSCLPDFGIIGKDIIFKKASQRITKEAVGQNAVNIAWRHVDVVYEYKMELLVGNGGGRRGEGGCFFKETAYPAVVCDVALEVAAGPHQGIIRCAIRIKCVYGDGRRRKVCFKGVATSSIAFKLPSPESFSNVRVHHTD